MLVGLPIIAIYVAGGAILAYILWAMMQIGKVRWRSCKECLHYHIPTDHDPCDECYLIEDSDRPSKFVLDIAYLERRHKRSS